MRIMVIDEESKYLWDFFDKSKLEGVDLIISCGDLNPNYLSFLTTFAAAPVLYVHGNHDENMIVHHQKVVYVLMIRFLNLKVCEFQVLWWLHAL